MRRFLPVPGDEPLDEVYADLDLPAGGARPHVYLGMVSSVDGSAVVDGRSTGLGGAGDRAAFGALRRTCDVILVGAGTVRQEDYRPPRAPEHVVARRSARGLAPRATIAVVTASGRLDPGSRLFADPTYRPVVVTSAATDVDHLAGVADVLRAGDAEVDLAGALAELAARGARRVLCEGGPSLNAALLRAGLVDELFLTIAPTLVGASAHRILDGVLPAPVDLELVELRAHDSELLLRYRVLPAVRGPDERPSGAEAPR
ncbi:MAG: dihydrofolate reductase family protein [Actinobacteria bacterium]|nr:dihydrofolate reductase family protein [Actinomycetota bacterium]